MKMGLRVSLFVVGVVVVMSGPAKAQVMSKSEYQAFIKRLDVNIPQWERVFKLVNVEDMAVSYAVGKVVAGNQEMALKNLELVHRAIALELVHPRLSNQIQIEGSLTDAASALSEMESLLPTTGSTKRWEDAGVSAMTEIGKYIIPLKVHIEALADELQDRANKCSE